jgi:hypothetical protein
VPFIRKSGMCVEPDPGNWRGYCSSVLPIGGIALGPLARSFAELASCTTACMPTMPSQFLSALGPKFGTGLIMGLVTVKRPRIC